MLGRSQVYPAQCKIRFITQIYKNKEEVHLTPVLQACMYAVFNDESRRDDISAGDVSKDQDVW